MQFVKKIIESIDTIRRRNTALIEGVMNEKKFPADLAGMPIKPCNRTDFKKRALRREKTHRDTSLRFQFSRDLFRGGVPVTVMNGKIIVASGGDADWKSQLHNYF